MSKNSLKIAYVSTWPPRECGIATFTQDMARHIQLVDPKIHWEVIALNEPGDKFKYDSRVKAQIDREDFHTYRKAADYINRSNIDIVVVQHEFNLYEPKGFLVEFLSLLKKEIITIFHSVPFPELDRNEKNPKRIEILKEVSAKSHKVITMCQTARLKMIKDYNIPAKKIAVIPHGGPDFKRVNRIDAKKIIGVPASKIILSSFGLIRQNKNFEQVIEALKWVVRKFPEVQFFICGKEHPRISKGYHSYLKKLVQKLDLKKNVVFVDHYLSFKEITNYLQATDIFIHSGNYLSMISSGVITFALTAGKCILSTPFIYAKEVLREQRGFFFPVSKPKILAKKIIDLLENPKLREKTENRAWLFGQKLLWSKIAQKYLDLFRKTLKETN